MTHRVVRAGAWSRGFSRKLLTCRLPSHNPFRVAAATWAPSVRETEAAEAAEMALLGLLQAGGSVLGQAVEQVTGGNLLSSLLIASAFTLSLVYLLRLAIGHLALLHAGAVRAPLGVRAGDAATEAAEWLARAATAAVFGWAWPPLRSPCWTWCRRSCSGGGRVSGPGWGRACRVSGHSDSCAGRGTGDPYGRDRTGGRGPGCCSERCTGP